MSRKTIILIIIIILALTIGGFFGFYLYLHKKTQDVNPAAGQGFFNLFTNNKPSKQAPPSAPRVVETSTSTDPGPLVNKVVPRLRHLTEVPIGGADFVMKDVYASTTISNSATDEESSTTIKTKKVAPKIIGTEEVIRWIERGTGNIFETSSSSSNILRLSNTTLTKIYEALFTDKGNSVLIRGLIDNSDAIQTQYGQLHAISATSTDQELKLQQLPINMTSVTLSPDKTKIFYILPTNPRGVISRTDGSSRTNVFDSPFHEWLADWPNAQAIVLNTKPSGVTEGFAYLLNPQTQSVVKLIGNKNGLTTLLSPDATKLLYGESTQGAISMGILDRKTGTTNQLFIKTFPEKCVWSKVDKTTLYCAVPTNIPFSTYPDVWYQGQVAFADTLWKINTSTGETSQILQPLTYTDDAIDMTNLTLDQKEDYIMFKNKNDLSLWGYQLVVASSTKATATSTASSTKTNK